MQGCTQAATGLGGGAKEQAERHGAGVAAADSEPEKVPRAAAPVPQRAAAFLQGHGAADRAERQLFPQARPQQLKDLVLKRMFRIKTWDSLRRHGNHPESPFPFQFSICFPLFAHLFCLLGWN